MGTPNGTQVKYRIQKLNLETEQDEWITDTAMYLSGVRVRYGASDSFDVEVPAAAASFIRPGQRIAWRERGPVPGGSEEDRGSVFAWVGTIDVEVPNEKPRFYADGKRFRLTRSPVSVRPVA